MRKMICVTLAVMLLGCSGKRPDPSPTSTSDSTNKPIGDPAAASPQGVVTTPAAVNGAGADQSEVVVKTVKEIVDASDLGEQYPTQTIEATGPVDSLHYVQDGFTGMTLRYGPGDFDFGGFPLQESEAWAMISPGQKVTVRAKYNKDALDAFLWKIHKADANPSPILTAMQVGEEFKKDRTAAHEKYSARWFYLTGNVASVEIDDFGLTLAKLDAGSFPSPLLVIEPEYANLAPIAVGQTLNVLCVYNPLRFSARDDETVIYIDTVRRISIKFPVDGVTYAKEFAAQK